MKTCLSIITALMLATIGCTNKGTEPDDLAKSCGNCHKLPPADSGHAYHTGMLNYKCSYCHQGYSIDNGRFSVNTATHRNGKIDVIFTAPWNDSGRALYDVATKQCSNVYCHGGIPQGTHASVHWNGPEKINGDCMQCHNLDTMAPGLYAGHYGHSLKGVRATTGSGLIRGRNVNRCYNCHGASIADTAYCVELGRVDYSKHINGVFDRGTCRDCHDPSWGTWQEYLNTHPGATPYTKVLTN
jgi:predicted CxxxxCH...CXXCH cytochrome family protein